MPRRALLANRLLDDLPSRERGVFVAGCVEIDLEAGQVLCEAGAPYRTAYFPLSGCIALVAWTDGRSAFETGLVGNEGMLGATLGLGVRVAPLRAVVHGDGSALGIGVGALERALRGSPSLRATLGRYLYVVMTQLSRAAACARFHEVEPRLARALLATHDRASGRRLELTQQVLADLLGVRRSAVTIAAVALQQRGLIRYARGHISVVSRGGLEAASCECYAASQGDYARRFGRSAVAAG